MLDGIKDEVASLSIDIAKKILVREVNEADNQAIVDQFFHKVGWWMEQLTGTLYIAGPFREKELKQVYNTLGIEEFTITKN